MVESHRGTELNSKVGASQDNESLLIDFKHLSQIDDPIPSKTSSGKSKKLMSPKFGPEESTAKKQPSSF
jgi:hypothetical protein